MPNLLFYIYQYNLIISETLTIVPDINAIIEKIAKIIFFTNFHLNGPKSGQINIVSIKHGINKPEIQNIFVIKTPSGIFQTYLVMKKISILKGQ